MKEEELTPEQLELVDSLGLSDEMRSIAIKSAPDKKGLATALFILAQTLELRHQILVQFEEIDDDVLLNHVSRKSRRRNDQ